MIFKLLIFFLCAAFFFTLIRRPRCAKNSSILQEDAIDLSQLKNPTALLKLPRIKQSVETGLQKSETDLGYFVDPD